MGKLLGKTALVTGGSSGLGLSTAKTFAGEGSIVYITGRRKADLDRAVTAIGRNATGIQGDVTKIEDIDRLVSQIQAERGELDVLVANAGTIEPQPLMQASEHNFDKTFDTNVRGVYFVMQRALPLLTKGSSVILLSSIAATKGIPGYGTYGATKAAVRSFVRTWTAELADRGIRVNAISPGPFDTPIMDLQADTDQERELVRSSFAEAVPMKRLGRPEELAAAALFLASEDSSYIAGIDLVVDGGLTAI